MPIVLSREHFRIVFKGAQRRFDPLGITVAGELRCIDPARGAGDGVPLTLVAKATSPFVERLIAKVTGQPFDRLGRDEDACLTVSFSGAVQVDGGVPVVVPDMLVIGQADLTWWTAGRPMVVPAVLLSDEVEELLANVDHLVVEDGQLHIRLMDRWELW